MRREYLSYILLFLAGMWIAQVIGREYFMEYGYLTPYHLRNFAEAEMDYVDLFWNLLWTRGKQFLGLWILQMTPCRRILPVLLKRLVVLIMGFFLMVCCMIVGSMGILILLVVLFPQGICYGIGIVGMLGGNRDFALREGKHGAMLGKIGISILFMITGCILETILGTRLLRYILKASKI